MKRSFVLFCGALLIYAAGVRAATPDLWVEATIEPATVPVNAQATFVLRFGHAVDVRAPELGAPIARLAEVRPLGAVAISELVRGGKRYRVLERRFAVLPFASGEMALTAEVSGTTPAAVPEAGAGGRFKKGARPMSLRVTPAQDRPDADWLPARNLQISAKGAAPEGLAVGDVWTRQILIEAEGVDGSVIPPLRWPVSADWSVELGTIEVGTRVESGRLIGYRQQNVLAQALRAGSLDFPQVTVRWWRVADGVWASSELPRQTLEVRVAPLRQSGVVMEPSSPPSLGGIVLACLVFVLFAELIRRTHWSPTTVIRAWWRWRRRRSLRAACLDADRYAAKCALLTWASEQENFKAGTLEALAERADVCGNIPLAHAIRDLEQACYGRRSAPWSGAALCRAL